jgi:hypothetical protein
MKPLSMTAALPVLALLALAGCQVNVDNQSKANLDHAADSIGDTLGNAADAVGDAADRAGATIENGADRAGATIEKGADDIGNHVDVNVDLHRDGKGRSEGNSSSDGNRH